MHVNEKTIISLYCNTSHDLINTVKILLRSNIKKYNAKIQEKNYTIERDSKERFLNIILYHILVCREKSNMKYSIT